MATSTTNLGLIKPAGTDKIRIAQINSNMDVIDTKMGAVGNTPLQTQVNTINGKTKILGAPDGHYNARYNNANGDDIDTIIGTILDAANVTNNQTFGIDVYGGAIPGIPGANRYFLLGWLNGTRQYGFVQIWSFSDFYIGLRNNADTFSIFPTSSVPKNMLGIPSMNNVHASIEQGNFVFVYNHDTLTTDLYTAKSNIAANAALSTSNLTAVPKGGLNALNSKLSNFLGYGNTLRSKNIDAYSDSTHTGIYIYNGYSTGGDATSGTTPFSNAYGIIFMSDNGFGGFMQIALNIITGKVYRRTYQSGAWNSWAAST